MLGQNVYFRYGIVEPALHSVRQNTYINIYLQSAMRVWLNLTMLNPSIAPDYDIMVYSVKFVTEEIIPAL